MDATMTGSGGNLPSLPSPEAAAFLEKLFLGIAVVGVLGMAFTTVRSIFYGFQAENMAQVLVYLVFLGIVAFRKRMNTFQSALYFTCRGILSAGIITGWGKRTEGSFV